MDSSTAAKVAELRRALGRFETTAQVRRLDSGGPLDEVLGGGFARGRVAELAGGRSSGKATLALRAAARATAAARLVAWIDAHRELYPPSAAALGVDLARLLVVRPGRGVPQLRAEAADRRCGEPERGRAEQLKSARRSRAVASPAAEARSVAMMAARAAEIVAQSRAFALIVVDLGAARLEGTAAARLRQAAHESDAAVVLLASGPGSSIATEKVEVARRALSVAGPREMVISRRWR